MSQRPGSQLLQYFAYEHLPEHLQEYSKPFAALAQWIEEYLPEGPERSVCLRKLLEAKDCAIRASLPIPARFRHFPT